jgi:histidyl-tRNA synthetase
MLSTERRWPDADGKINRMKRRKKYKWDVFVCHVSEDKEDVAVPLFEELTKYGIRVWMDKFTLQVGDSLRQKIDEGLARSRYGVVILSSQFFARPWPQAELSALFARAM